MTCPKCKSQLPAGAISCPKCGTRFKTKQCPYCKSAILFSATKCPRCGRALVQQAAAPAQYASVPNSQGGGFRWWYILIAAGIFVLGIVIGAVGMRQYIASSVSSALDHLSDSFKADMEPSGSHVDSSSDSSETEPIGQYYFADNVLVSEDVKIEITNWKVIQVGEPGNKYGEAPVIAFWYSTTNLTGNDSVNPMGAWIAMFTAIQDNNADMVNELHVAALPDAAFLDTQTATIKKDGTVECACAYTLSDTTTPVTLKATRGILGESLGEQTFNIAP